MRWCRGAGEGGEGGVGEEAVVGAGGAEPGHHGHVAIASRPWWLTEVEVSTDWQQASYKVHKRCRCALVQPHQLLKFNFVVVV